MCLSTVQEKTAQGYEATMELVVGKNDQPLAESQVEDALASAQAAGEAVATETSQAAKTAGRTATKRSASGGGETEKALETSKGMMQEGADRAAAALKPKSVKVGGA
eukprot:g27142.t1